MKRKSRLTLQSIDRVPSPNELYNELMNSKGWDYKSNRKFFLARDRALVALLYLCACRISEAIQLKRSQFKKQETRILIEAMLLSKRKPGKVKYREAWLPLTGERAKFTKLVTDYLELLEKKKPKADKLFPWSLEKVKYPIRGENGFYVNKEGEKIQRYSVRLVGTSRAWRVVKSLLPDKTAHWLRQYGDDYLYDHWDHDLMALSDYTKQDARTLQLYLRKRYQKYEAA